MEPLGVETAHHQSPPVISVPEMDREGGSCVNLVWGFYGKWKCCMEALEKTFSAGWDLQAFRFPGAESVWVELKRSNQRQAGGGRAGEKSWDLEVSNWETIGLRRAN